MKFSDELISFFVELVNFFIEYCLSSLIDVNSFVSKHEFVVLGFDLFEYNLGDFPGVCLCNLREEHFVLIGEVNVIFSNRESFLSNLNCLEDSQISYLT